MRVKRRFKNPKALRNRLIRVATLPKGCCYSYHRGMIRDTHHTDMLSTAQGFYVLDFMYKPKGQEGLVESHLGHQRGRR